ncbi:MAG: hypothetical protein HFG77_11235 [Hungatella sp.]|nr:hypothetical protein [Hungatella sp.]
MQATIYKITPFDADSGYSVKFAWNGNQVFKNRCIIRESESGKLIYDQTVSSFKLEHNIDLSKSQLKNGGKYTAYITVFDKDGNESQIQPIGTQFLCLKKPVFQFSNAVDGQTIASSSYEFSLFYFQENGEPLDSWSVSVYSNTFTPLMSSGLKYDTDTLTHTVSGFTNKNEYYIRATGQTINGMLVDTGYIGISVFYSTRDVFSLMELTNASHLGAIHLRSNIISSSGHLNHEAVFIDNEFIDLRKDELTYDRGFFFQGDFSFVIRFFGIRPNQEILSMYSDARKTLRLLVSYRVGRFGTDETRGCFELRVISNSVTSVYYSNKLPLLSEEDKIGLCISRRNGYYHIEAALIT